MKRIIALVLTVSACVGLLVGCGTVGSNKGNSRTITDSAGRQVEVPEKVESIVCVVLALCATPAMWAHKTWWLVLKTMK